MYRTAAGEPSLARYSQQMNKALVKRTKLRSGGVLPAVASGVIPGLGQLINGESDKAIGVFAVSAVAGLGFWSAVPLLGPIAGLVAGCTWIYGIADGYRTGRKKRMRG